MFATDRDLLVLEPNLFRDVGWLGQRLVKGIASVSGTTLTLGTHDLDFEAAGIEEGHVAIVGPAGEGAAFEVLERISPTQLVLSRLRASRSGPAIAPAPVTGAGLEIWTLRPQIALAHAQLMRMIGIDPDDPGASPAPSDITNQGAVRMVECLAALHLIHVAAGAAESGGMGGAASVASRAEVYLQRYRAARQQVAVHLDLDGDGLPDAARRFNIVQFIR